MNSSTQVKKEIGIKTLILFFSTICTIIISVFIPESLSTVRSLMYVQGESGANFAVYIIVFFFCLNSFTLLSLIFLRRTKKLLFL